MEYEETDSEEYVSEDYSSEAIDLYSNNYTSCLIVNNRISCNITLNARNLHEYGIVLNGPPPKDRMHRIELKCVQCDLETFPNEIANTAFSWKGLNFASSNIKRLKMNVLNRTAANTIHKLYLHNNSVTLLDDESLPASFSLYELDLSHNRIETVTGTRTFSKLRNLMHLKLAHNLITHVDPLVFVNLEHLMQLELNNNRILDTSFARHLTGFGIELTLSHNPFINLERNINVKSLFLWNSSLTNCSIGDSVESLVIADGPLQAIDLSTATSLRIANLSSNHLTHFEFQNPKSLRVLDLSRNKLQSIRIGNTPSINGINLARNNITSTLNVSAPESIRDLNLSHNNITNLAPETFKTLTRLRFLHLAHCRLRTLNADLFISIRNLFYLDLSHNRFVTLDLNVFEGFKEMIELDLDGNRLTNLNVEDLENSTNRYRLGIAHNNLNCTRLKAIIEILSRRRALKLYEPCDPQTCKENISGIACRSDVYVADSSVSQASNEADEPFKDIETRIWKKVEANLTAHYPENVDNQNWTNITREITHQLHNVLFDMHRQRILKNSKHISEHPNDSQNINHYIHSITNRFHNISERVERLRAIANGLLLDVTNITAESGSFNGPDHTTKCFEYTSSKGPTIVYVIIAVLAVFAAYGIYCGFLKLRKLRAPRHNYIVSYSE